MENTKHPRPLIKLRFKFVHSILFLLRHISNNDFLKTADLRLRTKVAQDLQKRGVVGHKLIVPEVHELTPRDFHKNFVSKGLPVLIRGGCKDWACSKKWSMDFLQKEYGEDVYNLASYKGFVSTDETPNLDDIENTIDKKSSVKAMIADFEVENKIYMRFCPILEEREELIGDLDKDWLKRTGRSYMGLSYQSFIGGAKKRTPIHCGMTSFFFVLPFGRKKWTLFPTAYTTLVSPEVNYYGHNYSDVDINQPQLKKYPGFECLDRYECEMQPGDILYVPAWYFHEVENLEPTWGVSVRLPYMFQALRESFAFTLKRFIFTKPNIIQVALLSYFKNDLAKRNKYLLTPKIYRDK